MARGTLNFRVSVYEKHSPELVERLHACGSYHRGRELVRLAALGLAVEQGGIRQAEKTDGHADGGKQTGDAIVHQTSGSGEKEYAELINPEICAGMLDF